MDNFIEMGFDEWLQTYKPITNHIDPYASFQDDSGSGIMFETYGDELAFVKSQSPDKIWMYGDGDDGAAYIWSGYGYINRLGYFITEVPCPPNTTIQIQVGVQWYFCEGCHAELEDPDNLIRDAFQNYDLEKCTECATREEITLVGL